MALLLRVVPQLSAPQILHGQHEGCTAHSLHGFLGRDTRHTQAPSHSPARSAGDLFSARERDGSLPW